MTTRVFERFAGLRGEIPIVKYEVAQMMANGVTVHRILAEYDTREQAERAARAEAVATWTQADEGLWRRSWRCSAPLGFRFASERLHEYYFPATTKREALIDASERGLTLEPCPLDCECREEQDAGGETK